MVAPSQKCFRNLTLTQPRYLRSITVGAWDEDAAEHIAYDAGGQRVFVASAASATVTVS